MWKHEFKQYWIVWYKVHILEFASLDTQKYELITGHKSMGAIVFSWWHWDGCCKGITLLQVYKICTTKSYGKWTLDLLLRGSRSTKENFFSNMSNEKAEKQSVRFDSLLLTETFKRGDVVLSSQFFVLILWAKEQYLCIRLY